MKILGIDEAGRGPVIGPLTIAAVLIDESKLEKLGFARDSKLIQHKVRVELAKKIKKITKSKVLIVQPKEIDAALDSEHLNLNWLEANKTAELINHFKPDIAYIDCPSPNKRAYTNYIKKLIKISTKIVAEHKAEDKFKVVAAASILAKVEREKEVKKIEKKYGSIGSGYPSNETCQEFLKKNWDKHPEIFRKTWISWKNYKKAKEQKKLEDF